MNPLPFRRILLGAALPLAGIVGLLSLAAGARPASDGAQLEPAARPNVIFISVDTLRADHLGCYGYARPTSPRLDAFATRSVRFAQALSQASWTLPSHMSMMTSQYPHVHGVQDNEHALADNATTLAAVLSDHGYHTTAFVSWVYLGRKYGFHNGFDEFIELLPPEEQIDSATSAAHKAEQVTAEAITWLEQPHDQPFFLFLHYFDPHINYEAPAPFGRMFDPDYDGPAEGTFDWLRKYIKGCHRHPNHIGDRELEHVTALYDGEIRYTDEQLGKLFDAIDRTVGLKNCLIVFTSDHGEELNEHGSMEGHQWTLYEEVIHVPLLLQLPGDAVGGRVVDQPVQSIDVAATILGLLEITRPATFQGQDHSALLAGVPADSEPSVAFGEIDRFNRKQYVRTDRFKLIHTDDTGTNERGVPVVPGYELYDLRRDPTEQNNLFEQKPEIAQRLVRIMEERKASRPDSDSLGGPSPVQLSKQDLERLHSLGYVGSLPE